MMSSCSLSALLTASDIPSAIGSDPFNLLDEDTLAILISLISSISSKAVATDERKRNPGPRFAPKVSPDRAKQTRGDFRCKARPRISLALIRCYGLRRYRRNKRYKNSQGILVQ